MVIGWLKISFAGAFPLVGIRQTLALRPANLRSLPHLHPDNRIVARDIGKFKLVDANLGVLRLLSFRVIKRSEILPPADLLKPCILVLDALLFQLRLALLGSY